MIHISSQRVFRAGLLVASGLLVGSSLSSQTRVDLVLATVVIVLACGGEWLEVRLGALGTFTLRPVVALVALWMGGPVLMVAAGILPLLMVRLLTRKVSMLRVLPLVGIDALALSSGYVVYRVMTEWAVSVGPTVGSIETSARAGSFIAFWIAQIFLQAIDLNLSEGIRLPAAARQLVRHAAPHGIILTAVAVSLSYIGANFGLVIMSVAMVVLIEAYYPWKLLGDQSEVLLTSLQMMAQAVDLKDPYTSNHSQRVSSYGVRIARALGLPESEVERIRIGGLMHDIGKIGISGRIIRKPGKLTPEEMALMMRHSSVSADIIEHLEILGESADMVRHHHEHFDGSGYPDGLEAGAIPIGSRIILAADAFDAITTDRPYRKGASKAEAVATIRKHAGTQFDTMIVDALERIAPSLQTLHPSAQPLL